MQGFIRAANADKFGECVSQPAVQNYFDTTTPPRGQPAASAGPEPGKTPKISVIITNYNYAGFLGEAIESVLAQTHDRVECIVVDDGSTDASRDVIAAYPQVKALFQANSRQANAARAGLRLATGSVVIFLDSDDYLHPEACSTIAAQWRDDMSALFYRLQIIEGHTPTNRTWPDKPFLRGGERAFVLKFGFIPSAPTSGNAFSRAHVERVFAMAQGLDQNSFDMALTNAAPFTGRVATTEQALGSYRIHASNLTSYGKRQSLRSVKLGLYYAFHAQQTARVLARASGTALPAWDWLSGPYNLKNHLLTRGFESPGLALPPRGALACALEAARQFAAWRGLPLTRRAANICSVMLFALLPRPLRRRISERVYAIDFGN